LGIDFCSEEITFYPENLRQMDLTVYKILLIIIAAIAVGSVILALELTHDSLFLTLWDIFLNMAL
jgi:hypothetical protein